MAKTVTDKDLGLKRIIQEVKKLDRKPHVKIGLLSDTANKDKEFSNITKKTTKNTSVLDVGIHNEFGTERIPARPFIRTTYDDNQSKWFGMIKKSMGDLYLGRSTVKQSLEKVGLQATSDMKRKFRSGDSSWKPNAPSTIKKKKSSKPLIDTAQLLNSIQHQVMMTGQ